MSSASNQLKKNSVPSWLDDDEDECFADGGGGRAARRQRQPGPGRCAKRQRAAMLNAIQERPTAEQPGTSLGFGSALDVTNEERAWVSAHLQRFCDAGLITKVLRRVKGGKEANVYVCEAHSSTGFDLAAAKLYRPRMLRNLRNDSQYRQGRPVLNGAGQTISSTDWRMHKAIAQKSARGQEAQQTSWVDHEYQTMQRLFQAGVGVPRPLSHSGYAILMEYLGDETMAAPMLSQVRLEQDEVPALFEQLMNDVASMLAQQVVHGDLSAYNVLYWEEQVKIIDLPQVVDPGQNEAAFSIFQRDVERLCQYFARYGHLSQPLRLAQDIWRRHAQPTVTAAILLAG
jgi:RIO kinase 1